METGRQHVVVASWCHVWNLDLADGRLVSHTAWDPQGANPRHYGWNQLTDLDGDGQLDYLNVSLTKHVDVLRNRDGRLELAWTRGWPDPVTTEALALHCPGDPVMALTGDGWHQVVAALFRGDGDRRWHLYVWDAVTGHLLAKILDRIPLGAVPLWGKGHGDALLCAYCPTIAREPAAGYEVWRLERRGEEWRPERVWNAPGAFRRVAVASDRLLQVGFNALDPRRVATARGGDDGSVAIITEGNGATRFWTGGDAFSVCSAPASAGDPRGEAFQAGSVGAPPLPKLPELEGPVPTLLLAADLYGTGRNLLLAHDGATCRVLAYERRRLSEVERFSSLDVPVVCSLDASGRPFLLTTGRDDDRNLWVEARGADRQRRWRFTFAGSAACGQYLQPIYISVGRFTGGPHYDVFAYTTKPGARSVLLDGRTGKPVWEKGEIAGIERHFQGFGGRMSAHDWNGDGADDLFFCNPDYYCVASGRTGELIAGPHSLPKLLGWWSAYASPAVLPREGAPPLVYLGGAYSGRMALSPDGQATLWQEFLATDRWPLFSGSDRFVEGLLPPGEGRDWRCLQAQVDGSLTCFEVATGRHSWTIQLKTAIGPIVTGDLDGDGRAEALLGGADGSLTALRDSGDRPERLWKKRFPAPVGPVILADIDADRRCEIILSTGDGNIHVLQGGSSERRSGRG